MASSDLLDTNRVTDDEPGEVCPENSSENGSEHGPDNGAESGSEKRVSLPKPDVNNITVLTENLPNEPILPWHHFDSPWLEKDEVDEDTEVVPDESEALANPEADTSEQLTLPLGIESTAPETLPPEDLA